MNKNEKKLRFCVIGLFFIYMVVLLRIILFKQVALYNLLSAFGSMERTISIIPFSSLLDMINNNISLVRIIENVLGNIVLFIPFGLLLPIVINEKSKKILLYGFGTSVFIEIAQFIFALGSSDIDDILFNTLGVIVGYTLYIILQRKSHTNTVTIISTIVLVITLGGFALGFLFVNHTELFMLTPKKVVVENRDIVQEFIDMPLTVSGKFIEINGNVLTIEQSVNSVTSERTLVDLEITPESNIFICYNKIDYFFNTISSEYVEYKQIEYSDFLQESNVYTKENNVQIWSSDGKTIDNLVIIEWLE